MLDSNVIALVLRLVISLGVVLGMMWLFAAGLKRRGIVLGSGGISKTSRQRSPFDLEIVARKGLGRSAQLAVVRIAGKTLVLGITEQHVTLLTEADAAFTIDNYETDADGIAIDQLEAQRTALPRTATSGQFPTWKTFIEGARDRTVRR